MNLTRTLFAAAALAFTSSGAIAATATPDDLIGTADLSSFGDATELLAMCNIIEGDAWDDASCGLDLQIQDKYEVGGYINVDGNIAWFEDVNEPGWFMLVFGNANDAYNNTYFFENLHELNYLAWYTDGSHLGPDDDGLAAIWDCFDGDALGECRLSHITTVVPIPAAGFLLIGGLGGLLALRRRKS